MIYACSTKSLCSVISQDEEAFLPETGEVYNTTMWCPEVMLWRRLQKNIKLLFHGTAKTLYCDAEHQTFFVFHKRKTTNTASQHTILNAEV